MFYNTAIALSCYLIGIWLLSLIRWKEEPLAVLDLAEPKISSWREKDYVSLAGRAKLSQLMDINTEQLFLVLTAEWEDGFTEETHWRH